MTAECLSDCTQIYRNCSVSANVRLDKEKLKGTMDQKDQADQKKIQMDQEGSFSILRTFQFNK